MGKIIAIDGPAGSGKGTVARLLAEKCHFTYIDTGLMYRAIGYLTLQNGIDISDKEAILDLLKNTKMEFTNEGFLINGKIAGQELRTEEVSAASAIISKDPDLRALMGSIERNIGATSDIVMEGRDITTAVFPDAPYKFYLDASLEERANRRFKENQEKNIETTYEEVYNNIASRDYIDMHKEVGALKRTDDQIYIDSTNLTIDEVVEKMFKIIEGE